MFVAALLFLTTAVFAADPPLCYEFPAPKADQPAPRLPIESIAFTPDGRTVLTTMTTATEAGRWKWVETTGKIEPLTPYSFPVDLKTKLPTGTDQMLAIAEGGRIALAGDTEENLSLHNLDARLAVPTHAFKDLHVDNGVGALALQVVVTPDGQRFLSSKASGTIDLWDSARTEKPTIRFKQPEPASLALSADGRWALVTSNPKSQLKLWDLREPEKPKSRVLFNEVKDGIQDLTFSADGKSAALRDGRGQVRLWKLDAPEKAETLAWEPFDKSQPIPAPFGMINRVGQGRLAFSPDGTQIAAIDPENRAVIWNLKTKKMTRLEKPSIAHSVAFAPNGKALAIGGNGGFCLHGVGGALPGPKPADGKRHEETDPTKNH